MTKIHRAADRGRTQTDWLESHHSFSFGAYHHALHNGFGSLRVINDNRTRINSGFAPHSHNDREILIWVVEGALRHWDSAGNDGIIRPGELQHMTAGTGIKLAARNAAEQTTRFMQIELYPKQRGLSPSYTQQCFTNKALQNRWCLIASQEGRNDSIHLPQYADVFVTRATAGTGLNYHLILGHMAWMQVITGDVEINGKRQLTEGDSASWTNPVIITLNATSDAEVMLFDLSS